MQDCPKYHYLKREGSTTQGKLYNYEKGISALSNCL